MVTHWETSNRPLFVKTIWQNGQHHVVLYKNGTTTLPTTKRQLSKRSYSSIVNRNSFEKLPIRNDNKLQISTMKLLKNDIKINGNKQGKCMNQSDIYQYKNPIVINLTPVESIKYKNFNFEHNQTPTVEYPTIDGNLTERVMVWLDLATQNLRKSKRIERKKRTTTANYPKSSNKSRNNQQYKPNYYYEDFNDDDDESTTPPLHQDRDEDTNCDELNNFIESKRQLHIFLPILTNKLSDCGSSLGSKSSSLLQQNQ